MGDGEVHYYALFTSPLFLVPQLICIAP